MTKRELGRPVGRLREQMEKLQLHSTKVVMLKQQLAMAEERMRRLEGEKQTAETRAEQAERSVSMHSALLQRVQQPAMVALIRQCMEREPMRRPTMSDIIGQLE